MTEAEWLVSDNPVAMWRCLMGYGQENVWAATDRSPASDRKLRLLACACHEITRRGSTGILHDEEALHAAYSVADAPLRPATFVYSSLLPHAHWTFALTTAERAARYAVEANYKGAAPSLLRCLFGNPWQPPANLVSLRWGFSDGVVLKLAQHIYDSRDFSALPILADALEEAGCANEDILNHCREPGLHGRGCWVLDLLLGKS